MSSLTFGPPVVLDDAHTPEPPPFSLLETPGVLKEPGDPHWLSGAAVYPYPEGPGFEWDPCTTGTFREKEEGEAIESQYFASFVGYLPITCSAMSIGDPDEFARRAEIALNAVQSYSVERQLALGTGVATNPFLADANHTLTGAAAVAQTPDVALAFLEEEIGETGKRGMIHATPPVVSRWFDQNRADTRPLITVNGTRVVSGGGYQGATPSGRAAAAAGESWVYATGPVEVRMGEVAVMDIKEVLDRSNNDVTFRAERYFLVTWDAQLQAAVLVDWTS